MAENVELKVTRILQLRIAAMHNSCHAQQLREKSQRQQSELPRQSGCSPSPLHPVTPSTPRLSSLAPPLTVHATSSSRCESCRDFRVCGQEKHTHTYPELHSYKHVTPCCVLCKMDLAQPSKNADTHPCGSHSANL